MAHDRLTVLVVGGYGTFGARIVEMLAREKIHIIVAGRSSAAAHEACQRYSGWTAEVTSAGFDRDSAGDLANLEKSPPDILIDASGPWQDYGDRPYRLVEACIAAGIHYLDLADSTGFVDGITAYDDQARAAGVTVLSGVSSFPVLTAAAVRHLSRNLTRIEGIEGGIAPSPYAGFGGNVIRAICNYAGRPVTVRTHGRPRVGHAFTETREFLIAPPGVRPLGLRLFGLLDVPDHAVLPALWPDLDEVWMGVAPMPRTMFRGLILASRLVRLRLLPGLGPFAPLVKFATDHIRWGEDRGGMFVRVHGRRATGEPVLRTWHMIAEGKDGPKIPSMAIPVIVRRWIAGHAPPTGARAAVTDLEIADYDRMFAGLNITTGVTEYAPGRLDTRENRVEVEAALRDPG